MRIRCSFPQRVHEVENVWIPMPDGVRLAARMWIPEGAEKTPVPAILEYIPYRKRDDERMKASSIHGYFAGHGYASLRVDLRGSGDSEGVLEDEYLKQEQDDGVEVLGWMASQPWCNGSIGMIGISWGGFNGLQIAARQPPELKAIITVCSTDDRYADDVHHMGGCLLGDNLSWASTMFAYNALPPDPEIVGKRWRAMWRERLERSGLWLEKWLRHQCRDEYWEHGSICEDYEAIKIPVFSVSGWADGYSNAVFRLLANLKVPRKGLIGPWSHKYPHLGIPGPAIGFLQETLRWWDKWLKGIETGIMDEPILRVWMQDSVPPTTSYKYRPGRWVAELSWPSMNIMEHKFVLAPGRLVEEREEIAKTSLTIRSPLTVGLFAGKWCSYAAGPDLAHDQRQEDGGALIFQSTPLTEPMEILGAPILELELVSDKPVAMIAARLSDITPDDKATRITYGLLNLTHHKSSKDPKSLEPNRRYRVRLALNHIAQAFPAGHRLRISLSTSYWPLAWPPPEPVRLTIFTTVSRLTIPIRPPRVTDQELFPFAEPESASESPYTIIEPEHHNWWVHRNLATDESTLEVVNDHGTYCLEDIDLEMKTRAKEWYTSRGDDFGSVRGETLWERSFRRGVWHVRTMTRTVLTSTAHDFHVQADLDAFEGDKRVYRRSWDILIPRDHV